MTDEERAILAATPREGASAGVIARATGGAMSGPLAGSILRRLEAQGYVAKALNHNKAQYLYSKLRDAPKEAPKHRPGVMSVEVPAHSATWSSAEIGSTSVSLPMPPWGAAQ